MKFFRKQSKKKSKAWELGYYEGKKLIVAKNPFKERSDEWFDYEDGWFYGESERLEKQ